MRRWKSLEEIADNAVFRIRNKQLENRQQICPLVGSFASFSVSSSLDIMGFENTYVGMALFALGVSLGI
jgi:hypothetical protein